MSNLEIRGIYAHPPEKELMFAEDNRHSYDYGEIPEAYAPNHEPRNDFRDISLRYNAQTIERALSSAAFLPVDNQGNPYATETFYRPANAHVLRYSAPNPQLQPRMAPQLQQQPEPPINPFPEVSGLNGWAEIKRLSQSIYTFAINPAHLDINLERYHQLYAGTVNLLKCLDGLDPEKVKKAEERAEPIGYPLKRKLSFTSEAPSMPKKSELMAGHPQLTSYPPPMSSIENPIHQTNQTLPRASSFGTLPPSDGQGPKKMVAQPKKKPKNMKQLSLKCLLCGTTESPEWRKSSNGVHCVCKPCTLHYGQLLRDNPPHTR